MFRRDFLKTSGLLSLTPMVPGFVNSLAASTKAETDQKILVVVELSGGNDGINTVVPFKDEVYQEVRPKLALPENELHKLNDELGLHRSMTGAKELFDNNQLAIINGVGYPNPNRSHFESMAIWHRGLRDTKRESGAGWIGHALDLNRKSGSTDMDGYFVGRQAVSAALVSRRAQIAALSRFQDLQLDPTIKPANSMQQQEDIAAFVQRQVTSSYATAKQIESVSKKTNTASGYPGNRLGQQMRLVSQLIKTGSAARVYYTVQSGYDTHSAQANTHSSLLFALSRSLKAFTDDLQTSKLDDRVVVLVFSEFGRRVRENGSIGTDHGTAGPMFLAGSPVKSGLHGATTNLSDLEDGDIKVQFDFRQVYATLLDEWLGIDSEQVLEQKFSRLDLLG